MENENENKTQGICKHVSEESTTTACCTHARCKQLQLGSSSCTAPHGCATVPRRSGERKLNAQRCCLYPSHLLRMCSVCGCERMYSC